MAREGQGYPCYQRDMMMMMIDGVLFILMVNGYSCVSFFLDSSKVKPRLTKTLLYEKFCIRNGLRRNFRPN